MGGGASRREPEVHVVVVQSQENGKMDAKLLRQTFVRTGEAEKSQESIKGNGESTLKSTLSLYNKLAYYMRQQTFISTIKISSCIAMMP